VQSFSNRWLQARRCLCGARFRTIRRSHIAPAQRAVADTRELLSGLQKEIADGASGARIRELVNLTIQRLPQA
jgi:hypothetical protein